MDPQQLGFTPRRPVGWLAPLLLLNTGLRTLLAVLFGAYLDKRELQNALSGESFSQPGTDGELWFDYVADLGDGFDPTYSVAYLLAQPGLEIDGRELPRGQVLLMGGDQVYPVANGDEYENRMKGPYRAALPEPPAAGPRPTLFALPGNHDWYDGLTAFLRLFARRKDGHIGGWRTQQRRSYFAVRLPSNWWLFAIDEQFGAYIDDPQLLYFEKAASGLGPDDRIILMTPSPTWVKAAKKPGAYDAVDYFIRTILAPTGAQVRLLVSGDLHHYARYTGEDRELITCGGGGAYLLGTHQLPERLTVPPKETLTRSASRSRDYELATRFPSAADSRRMSWGIFRRAPARNPGFASMLGIVHTLTMLAMAGAASQGGIFQRLFSIPLVFMLVVILAGTVMFAQPPGADQNKHARHWILGLLHGFAQIGLATAGAWAWLRLPFHDWAWPGPLIIAAILYGPVIAFLATQLLALYLLIASYFDVNVNELFAGQGIEDSKSFLRMHIAADGTLTIYPLGVDKICRRWQPDPDGAPDSSWLLPKEPLHARLIEPPIVVDGPVIGAGAPTTGDAAPA
ncbi:calcineurin-like phosphoesterase family protein [Pseudosporangium ferrugineum]|uniref:Calcineurin-like phosphoesterase family protein n=2 Tax=Pseudosporangium ferrugineum TaxID=439699 RepID=A0A2T0S7P2_9ACTN|nr:calcineurin-like phosphoesterase family protein [Pseudosporangium ferrugineum]